MLTITINQLPKPVYDERGFKYGRMDCNELYEVQFLSTTHTGGKTVEHYIPMSEQYVRAIIRYRTPFGARIEDTKTDWASRYFHSVDWYPEEKLWKVHVLQEWLD